jgi:hypothetical protein
LWGEWYIELLLLWLLEENIDQLPLSLWEEWYIELLLLWLLEENIDQLPL